MSRELAPLIEQAEASEFSHVVVFLDEEGIRWRPLPEPDCQCIAEILADYGAKVMLKQEFIDALKLAALASPAKQGATADET